MASTDVVYGFQPGYDGLPVAGCGIVGGFFHKDVEMTTKMWHASATSSTEGTQR